jgi:hypothetical protein
VAWQDLSVTVSEANWALASSFLVGMTLIRRKAKDYHQSYQNSDHHQVAKGLTSTTFSSATRAAATGGPKNGIKVIRPCLPISYIRMLVKDAHIKYDNCLQCSGVPDGP